MRIGRCIHIPEMLKDYDTDLEDKSGGIDELTNEYINRYVEELDSAGTPHEEAFNTNEMIVRFRNEQVPLKDIVELNG